MILIPMFGASVCLFEFGDLIKMERSGILSNFAVVARLYLSHMCQNLKSLYLPNMCCLLLNQTYTTSTRLRTLKFVREYSSNVEVLKIICEQITRQQNRTYRKLQFPVVHTLLGFTCPVVIVACPPPPFVVVVLRFCYVF